MSRLRLVSLCALALLLGSTFISAPPVRGQEPPPELAPSATPSPEGNPPADPSISRRSHERA